MDITKRGVPPSERKWSGVCRACGSEAEARESELKNITHDWRDGGSFAWMKCPVCDAGEKDSGYGGMIFYPAKERP